MPRRPPLSPCCAEPRPPLSRSRAGARCATTAIADGAARPRRRESDEARTRISCAALQATMDPARATSSRRLGARTSRVRQRKPAELLYLASFADACMVRAIPAWPECASADPVSRWASRDADNAVPRVLLAERARQRGDLPGMREQLAFARRPRALRFLRAARRTGDLARAGRRRRPWRASRRRRSRRRRSARCAPTSRRPRRRSCAGTARRAWGRIAASCRRLARAMADRADTYAARWSDSASRGAGRPTTPSGGGSPPSAIAWRRRASSAAGARLAMIESLNRDAASRDARATRRGRRARRRGHARRAGGVHAAGRAREGGEADLAALGEPTRRIARVAPRPPERSAKAAHATSLRGERQAARSVDGAMTQPAMRQRAAALPAPSCRARRPPCCPAARAAAAGSPGRRSPRLRASIASRASISAAYALANHRAGTCRRRRTARGCRATRSRTRVPRCPRPAPRAAPRRPSGSRATRRRGACPSPARARAPARQRGDERRTPRTRQRPHRPAQTGHAGSRGTFISRQLVASAS